MNRSLITAVVVVLLIGATAAVALPLVALQGFRDALSARDAAAVQARIDAERLRASLTARLRARYGGAASALPLTPIVDRLLMPNGLIAAICDGGALTVDGRVPSDCAIEGRLGNVRFESANRLSAALTRDGSVVATLVMDRAGLHWRLVDLVLPAPAYDRFKDEVLG